MFIQKLIQTLERHKVRFAIAGGYAVALHGAVRGTADIDLVIALDKENFTRAEAALKAQGLSPRLPVTAENVFQFRREYIQNRNLIAWSFVNIQNPVEIVDIIVTHDLKQMKIKQIKTPAGILPILSIEDLIAMKKQSARPQDLADIEALKNLQRGSSA